MVLIWEGCNFERLYDFVLEFAAVNISDYSIDLFLNKGGEICVKMKPKGTIIMINETGWVKKHFTKLSFTQNHFKINYTVL